MYKIGQGILVHFDNDRGHPNMVILPEGEVCHYRTGEMLLELLSDQAKFLLSVKPLNMIRLFPGREEAVSEESIVEGFQWLYGTVTDDDLPVATTLFRSQFSEIILDPDSEVYVESHANIEGFLENAFAVFSQQLTFFYDYCKAMAGVNSGLADAEAESEMEELWKEVESKYENLRRKCGKRHKDGLVTVEVLEIRAFLSLLLFECCRMKRENRVLKTCAYCGRPFIPMNRNDAIYCTNPNPENNGLSCQQFGPRAKQAEKLKSDPAEHADHNKIARLRMAVSRADPTTQAYHRKKLEEAILARQARKSSRKPDDD